MQRRKSVELSTKLDVVNKENTDLQSMVSNMKSQRELALELSAKALMEQNAQIEALQRQLAEKKTVRRSITDSRLNPKNVSSSSCGPKKQPRSMSTSTASRWTRQENMCPLSTITSQMKNHDNSYTYTETMHDHSRKSEIIITDDSGSTELLSSAVLDDKISRAEQDLTELKWSPRMEMHNSVPMNNLLSGLGSESESFM